MNTTMNLTEANATERNQTADNFAISRSVAQDDGRRIMATDRAFRDLTRMIETFCDDILMLTVFGSLEPIPLDDLRACRAILTNAECYQSLIQNEAARHSDMAEMLLFAGNVALYKAEAAYDSECAEPFSQYATAWIRGEMRSVLCGQGLHV